MLLKMPRPPSPPYCETYFAERNDIITTGEAQKRSNSQRLHANIINFTRAHSRKASSVSPQEVQGKYTYIYIS